MFRLGSCFFIPDEYRKVPRTFGGAGEYSLNNTYHKDIRIDSDDNAVKYEFYIVFECIDLNTKQRLENEFLALANGLKSSLTFNDDEDDTNYSVIWASEDLGITNRVKSDNGIFYSGTIHLRQV